jgi:hypothetical protein
MSLKISNFYEYLWSYQDCLTLCRARIFIIVDFQTFSAVFHVFKVVEHMEIVLERKSAKKSIQFDIFWINMLWGIHNR